MDSIPNGLPYPLFIISSVLISDFDYDLPVELIAQAPLAERADSRMLHMNRKSGAVSDCRFRDFPQLLRPDDLVVFNNTRVFPARLFARKSATQANADPGSIGGQKIEVLLTRRSRESGEWECLVRPGRKIKIGDVLFFGEKKQLRAEVVRSGQFGERHLRFDPVKDFFELIEHLGHVPLPPYIKRGDEPADKERYQTVYARERGSVAAPTAGLHFSPEILEQIRCRGVETTEITLHVGLGTFQPVRENRVQDHRLHREAYYISSEAKKLINAAHEANRRVIAIGTTTARALEHSASFSPKSEITAGAGDADIFIYPGHEFRIVNGLLTNFHLPKSTLLMLVSALAGREHVLAAYKYAVSKKYRFYSYGDCMFLA